MQQEERQQNEKSGNASRQDRICNRLTFVGLFAVIAVGGFFIFADPSAEVKAENTLPGELPEEVVVPAEVSPEPEIVVKETEENPDTIAEIDSTLVNSADSIETIPTDTTVVHPQKHNADSLRHHKPNHEVQEVENKELQRDSEDKS